MIRVTTRPVPSFIQDHCPSPVGSDPLSLMRSQILPTPKTAIPPHLISVEVFVSIVGRDTLFHITWANNVFQLLMSGNLCPIALAFTSCNNINLVSFDQVVYVINFPAVGKDSQTVPVFKHYSDVASRLVCG